MKCHNCQAELTDGAVFCGTCGSPVKHIRSCDNCGVVLDNAASFCGHCGKHIKYVAQSHPDNLVKRELRDTRSIQLQKKISFWRMMRFVTILVLWLIVLGLFITKPKKIANLPRGIVVNFFLSGIIYRGFGKIISKYECDLQNMNH